MDHVGVKPVIQSAKFVARPEWVSGAVNIHKIRSLTT
ncbi:uncharacterized protein METZ01_LOCUS248107, partial [marine metagenome]